LEVRLLAAELVAERRGGPGPRPAGVLPLRLGGQPELPVLGKSARPHGQLGELPAERLPLGEVDVADGAVVPPRHPGPPAPPPTPPRLAPCPPAERAGVGPPSPWPSPGRRPGSSGGLPTRTPPGGHQQSRTPAMVRSSPAFVPSKPSRAAARPAAETSMAA